MIFIAKLILFSSFIKNQTHSVNLIQYMSTREGVELNANELEGNVSEKQKELIKDVVNGFSFLKELEEYNNFLNEGTKAKASQFLTEAFALIDDQLVNKEIYLKYIAERPRVEKINDHGLFNSFGEADLKKEIEDIKNHKGVVWTHIISLKRQDAEKLGYDNLKQWQLLLKTKMPKIAESMNIELKNLVWNAAFHNEGYHPHVHLVMYSKNTKEGYLKQEGIKKIKSILMNEIYKEDLLQIKETKTLTEEELTEEFGKELDKIYANIVTKNYSVDKKLVDDFIELSKMLPDKGKMVYAYQSKEVKEQIDKIVESITENKNIKLLYEKYHECKKDMAAYYSSKGYEAKDITKDKEFRKLQNMITKTADKFRKIKLETNEQVAATEKVKSADSIKDRLQQLDVEAKKIESKYKEEQEKKNKAAMLNQLSRETVRKNNLKQEKEEVLESKEKSVQSIENKFLSVLDKYNNSNELFKAQLEAAACDIQGEFSLKQFDDLNFEMQTHIMKALALIVSDPDIKGDYENYKKACEDYNLLSGDNVEDHSDLKDMANEIIGTVNYNIAIKEKEVERLSIVIEDDIKTMENKFLPVLNDCNENNIEFKNVLTTIPEKKCMYDVRDEPKEVNKCVNEILDIVLNDPDIKEDYETYKQDCAKYTEMTNESTDKLIDNGLLDMKNEVLNLLNCENNLSTGGKNELENKVVNGANKIKKEFSLSPKIDVTYNDYNKQDQETLKYTVKGIVFDIVDSLYFLAKEGERQKNKLIRMNKKINNDRKQEQQSRLTY